MSSSVPRLRVARIGIFVFLAMLVVLLGAAAKHSQYEGFPSHGYLAKAVKMAGVRVDPNMGLDPAPYVAPVVNEPSPEISVPVAVFALSASPIALVPLLSPPLRI